MTPDGEDSATARIGRIGEEPTVHTFAVPLAEIAPRLVDRFILATLVRPLADTLRS